MARGTALKYAIVDIETTGGRPDRDKITEIGIVLHNGREITETWSSLVNPGVSIPPFISRMTGITQEMVDEAPYFHEVAREVILRLEHAVFVAHNARFDYHFIRESFRDLGFTFSRPYLCTVKLSRQAFPGLPSYSLENLIRHFGIPAERRHRALDDALATATLLEKVLIREDQPALIPDPLLQRRLPRHLAPDTLNRVPNQCGVYYFRNRENQVIYVGKSIHMRKRLDEHLASISRKAERLDREIADIDWVVTGSELYAAILESYEIKRLQPSINRAQRARQLQYGIQQAEAEGGHLRLKVHPAGEEEVVLQRYAGKTAAFSALAAAVKRFDLCRNLSIEFHPGKPCFEYQVGDCRGACCGMESPDSYNERVRLAAAFLGQDLEGSFYLLDEGPEPHTRSVFAIEGGLFRGMGVLGPDDGAGLAALEAAIRPYPDHPEVRRLLRQFMARQRYERVEIPVEDGIPPAWNT